MAAASQQHTAFALGRLGSGASSTFAPLGCKESKKPNESNSGIREEVGIDQIANQPVTPFVEGRAPRSYRKTS